MHYGLGWKACYSQMFHCASVLHYYFTALRTRAILAEYQELP